jgi:AhpD family alkylhydroperoxidase
MQARMGNPVMVLPGAMKALIAVGRYGEHSGLSAGALAMVHLRASQINGCSVCVDMHARDARKAGESEDRVFAVAAWREAPYFSAAERAALALTESVTRLSDRPDPVPDDVWDEAAKHFDEQQLAGLVMAIATVNMWNRVNAATRQIAGQWTA